MSDLTLLRPVRLIGQAHDAVNARSAVEITAGQDLAYLQLQRGMVALDALTFSQLDAARQAW